MHLLLVEDNQADVSLIRKCLQEMQPAIQLSIALDGEIALAFLHRRAPYSQAAPPDLILLDLNLPGKSGFEVLAALAQEPRLKFLPVVVFTSTTNPQDIDRCYELGASAYLVKPFTLDEYFAVVKLTVNFWSACRFPLQQNGA